MTRSRVVATALALVIALVALAALVGGDALAQPQGGPPPQGPPPGGMRGGGMQGGMGMMGGQAGLCTHLIGAPMPSEPRAMGRMLQLCGEMFKSMGESMMKHGKHMESGG